MCANGRCATFVGSSFVVSMPVGDIDVLKRINKQDKRADRAARILIKKLSSKQRNKKLPYAIARRPTLPLLAFASETNFAAHEDVVVAQRRLVRARDENGKRAFYVCELGSTEDGAATLLVVPKSRGASTQLLCEQILKRKPTRVKTSDCCVRILESCGPQDLHINGAYATQIFLTKVHVENGITVFYALHCQNAADSPPWSLGLNKATYTEIQSKVAKLLGAKLTS